MGDATQGSKELLIQDNWLADEQWELLAGLRYQNDSDFGDHFAPKFNLRRQLTQSAAWDSFMRLGWGRGYRVANLKERHYQFDHSQLGYVVNGNPDLQPELSSGFQLGYGVIWTDQFSLDANLFYNRLKDFIQTDFDAQATQTRGDGAAVYRYLTSDLIAPTSLTEDSLTTVLVGSEQTTGTQMDMGWYWYDFTTHAISVNDSNGWLLRSAEGNSYSRFRATALSYDTTDGLRVTFSFDTQASGTVQFAGSATFDAHIAPSGGEVCFDADNNAEVACDSSLWDLKLGIAGRDWYLRSNGGVSGAGKGAAFGPLTWDALDDYTSGIFAAQSWYAYNLDGTHRLHPNYRVYWISADTNNASASRFAVQITGYYDDTGMGGHPTLRWREITND